MNPQINDRIRENICKNSELIRKIKDEALKLDPPYICPQHEKEWAEYRGRKYEATKWLIALHQARGNQDRIKNHLPKRERTLPLRKTVIQAALDSLKKIQEQLKDEPTPQPWDGSEKPAQELCGSVK